MNYQKLEEIAQNWKQTGLIENFDDKVQISSCLQSQLKYNEEESNCPPVFNRMTIPLMIRTFSSLPTYEDKYFSNFENEKEVKKEFNTEIVFNPPNEFDKESEYCVKICTLLKDKISSYFENIADETITFHYFTLENGKIIMVWS
jgi:hypothetical protein